MAVSPYPCIIDIRNRGAKSELRSEEQDFILGRSSKLKLAIDSQEISREHLRVEIIGTKIWITDLASTNGTYYKGKRLEPRVSIPYEGGELCMGPIAEGVYCEFRVPGVIEFSKQTPTDAARVVPPQPSERTLMNISKLTERSRLIPSPVTTPDSGAGNMKPTPAASQDLPKPLFIKTIPTYSETQPAPQQPQTFGSSAMSLAPSPSEAVSVLRQSMHDGVELELQNKRQELQKISTELQLVESRLRELQFERTKLEALVKKIAEKEAEELKINDRIRAVLEKEAQSENNFRLIESKRQQQEQIILQMNSEIEVWRAKITEVQNQYHAEEARVADLMMLLKGQEGEYQKKLTEVAAEKENLLRESDLLKKKLRLEAESIEAESQLKRAHIERDVEEFRTRKITLEREVQDLSSQQQHLHPIVSQLKDEHHRFDALVQNLTTARATLEQEVQSLETKKRAFTDELNTLQQKISDLQLQSQVEISNTKNYVDQERRSLEIEVQTQRAKLQQELDNLKIQTDNEIREKLRTTQLERAALEGEIQSMRSKAHQEIETMRSAAERDIQDKLKTSQLERATIEGEIASLKSKAQQEVELLRVQVEREIQEKQQAYNLESTRTRAQLEQEILEKRRQAFTELETLRAQMEQEVTQRRASLHEEVDKVRADLDREVKQLKEKSEFEATERRAQILTGVEELKIRTETEVEQWRKDAKDSIARDRSVFDSEILERKKKLEVDIEQERNRADQELRAREQKLLAELAEEKNESDAKIKSAQENWEKEYQTMKSKAQRECDEITNRWKGEFEQLKQKEMSTLTQWKADENKKIQERLSADIETLSHEIASKTLAAYQQSGATTIYVQELMMSLQERLKSAILHGIPTTSGYHPNSKNSKKRFWTQTVVFAGALAIGVLAFTVLPDKLKNHIDAEKKSRSALTEEFLNRVKKANEEKLALNLVDRPEFQESYVENVLYNEGYSQVKLDETIHNEWIAKLNEFLMKNLKLDDRVIVQYIPLENGLVKELEEQRKILNARNFDVILGQMKTAEEEKTSQMYLLLGGRDQWLKLREFEKNFFSEKMKALGLKQSGS